QNLLGRVVSRHPRRAAPHPDRWLLERPHLRPLRHRHGLHHSANPQRLLAHPAKIRGTVMPQAPFRREPPARAPSTLAEGLRLNGIASVVALLVFARPIGAESPLFALHTAAGATFAGTLTELADGWAVRLQGDQAVKVKGVDVVSLRRADRPLRPRPAGPHVVLANGSRLPGEVVKIADDRLHFRPAAPVQSGDGKDWDLPLSGVLAVWLHTPFGMARSEDNLRR